jgi:hypothetical protein
MALLSELEALLGIIRKAKSKADLEKAVTQLEAEVARLKLELAKFEPHGERCKACGHLSLFLTASKRSPMFGELGGVDRTNTCRQCQFTEQRLETPGA